MPTRASAPTPAATANAANVWAVRRSHAVRLSAPASRRWSSASTPAAASTAMLSVKGKTARKGLCNWFQPGRP